MWDIALLCTARAGTVHGAGSGLAVVARQISDFPITKMLFSPFEKLVRSSLLLSLIMMMFIRIVDVVGGGGVATAVVAVVDDGSTCCLLESSLFALVRSVLFSSEHDMFEYLPGF